MIWGYLSNFWDSVASSTVSAGNYGVDWFQSIGNAVAGALAGIFIYPLKAIIDFALALAYLISNLIALIGVLFLPLKWLIVFLGGIYEGFTASAPPINSGLASSTVAFVHTIPLYDTIGTVISAVGFLVIVIVALRNTNL